MGANSSKVVPSSSKPRHQPQTQDSLLGRNKKALHAAAKAGDAAQLEQLLQPLVTAVTAEMAVPGVYPGPAAAVLGTAVGWRDRHGRTPFLEACLHGSWECAELLLEAGSNIVAVDAAGNGCLHLASIKGHGHVVDQLLSKAEVQGIAGRLVNTINRFGFSALHYAAWSGHANIARKLLMSTNASDRLMLQACTDNYDKWLIVSQGSTALHVAALQQHASVVLAIMQHYALLLTDWLPVDSNSRRPVDPRTWPDAQGATPLHVALWRGLDRSSQLAALLHPRTDITTLFNLHQLEDLRKRGPPTLQVLAAAALRFELLRQLQQQQALLQEQRQIEALQAAARAQQRQRARQQEKQRQREQIWQRWWGRGLTDREEESGPAAGVVPASRHAADNSSAGSSQLGSGQDQQQQQQTAGCGTAQQQEEPLDLSPWHELCRTPSITLGAMQQYSSAGDEHAHVLHSVKAGQHSTMSQTAASADMQLPGEANVQSGPQTAVTASPATATGEGAQQKQVLSASSITLGVLDRIWLASEGLEQQKQQQDISAAPSTPEVTAEGSKAAIASSNSSSSSGGSSTGGNSNSSLSRDAQHATEAVPAGAAAAAAVSGMDCAMQQQHVDSSSDLAVMPVGSEHTGNSPGNQHLYKGVGSLGAFQLFGPPVACSTDTAYLSMERQADDTAGSPTTAAAPADKHVAAGSTEQNAGVSCPCSAAGVVTAGCKQAAAPPLATMSVTLGQLPGMHQQQQQQEAPVSRKAPDATPASPVPSRYSATAGSSSSGRSPVKQSVGHRLVRQSSKGRLQPLLATAGIKQGDLDQPLTPLAWKLLQQQHQERAASSKQQTNDLVSAIAPENQEVWAADERSQHKHQRQQQQQQQQHSFPRSPHRRSFEMPGASSSMSGLLGARRQHVDHMRSQAADMNKHSFLSLHTGAQGLHTGAQGLHSGLLAGGGTSSSRRNSLDRTGLTLEVATSLAGALPGCVSETLTQYLQVYSPGSGAAAGGRCSCGVVGEGRTCGCASHEHGMDDVQGNMASPQLSVESGLHDAGFNRRGSSNNQRRSLSLFRRDSSDRQGLSQGSHTPTGTETCAVCMDEPCAVAFTGCSHSLCFTCAGCIVGQGVGVRPPLCPFCRTAIRGLQLAALQVSS